MDHLIHFLKNATSIELLLMAGSVLFALVLVPIGIIIVFKAKSRLTVVLYIVFALLALVFAVSAV